MNVEQAGATFVAWPDPNFSCSLRRVFPLPRDDPDAVERCIRRLSPRNERRNEQLLQPLSEGAIIA